MASEDFETLFITQEEESFRLDQLLTKRFLGKYSRTYFQKLIEEGFILLNGDPVKKRVKPKRGDEVEIEFVADNEMDLLPEAIPLDILYEDNDLIVINKPPNMVVHPAPGNWTGTFVNALIYHCQSLKEVEGNRPGIVHRLDKDTSGVMIAAKNALAQRLLIEAFSKRKVIKEYLAAVIGQPQDALIDLPIGRDPKHRQKMAVVPSGRAARSHIKMLKPGKEISLIQVGLETGRTHQIRVHLSHIGYPVLGDSLYGRKTMNERLQVKRQLLHAYRLCLLHPMTGEAMEFIAPLPEDMIPYK